MTKVSIASHSRKSAKFRLCGVRCSIIRALLEVVEQSGDIYTSDQVLSILSERVLGTGVEIVPPEAKSITEKVEEEVSHD